MIVQTQMLKITPDLEIPKQEVDLQAIRSQGSGGQNVNKVSTAIHLRFDIAASSLPEYHKTQLLEQSDQRINKEGIIIIKAQSYRTQEKNRDDALQRLTEFIKLVCASSKKRHKTKPSRSSQRKRLDRKTKHSKKKALRKKVSE